MTFGLHGEEVGVCGQLSRRLTMEAGDFFGAKDLSIFLNRFRGKTVSLQDGCLRGTCHGTICSGVCAWTVVRGDGSTLALLMETGKLHWKSHRRGTVFCR